MKRLLLFSFLFSLVCLSMISSDFQFEVIPKDTPILLTPSVPSESLTEYIDAVQTTTYGTITNPPPGGMGTSNLNDRTTLTEASYNMTGDTVVLESTVFDSTPAGWTVLAWTITTGVAYANIEEARLLCTKTYDLSSYYIIRLDFDYASYNTNYIEAGDYQIKIKVTASTYEYTNIPARASTVLTAMATTDEYTTYDAVTVAWVDNTADDAERLKIDNVDIYGLPRLTRYRFAAVFRFDSVQLGEDIYMLNVVFNESLSGLDDLDFFFKAGDTTPDNEVASNKQTSFSVDVTSYVTGETIYLSIQDDYRNFDETQTSAYISAIYLYSPGWHICSSAILYFRVPLDETGMNMLLIFLGLCMIPASTLYLVKGGKDDLSFNKVFFFLVAFMLGWAIFLGGIYG